MLRGRDAGRRSVIQCRDATAVHVMVRNGDVMALLSWREWGDVRGLLIRQEWGDVMVSATGVAHMIVASTQVC